MTLTAFVLAPGCARGPARASEEVATVSFAMAMSAPAGAQPHIKVKPSGDQTGWKDAKAIASALQTVKNAGGGHVHLTDGNLATVDRYYMSWGVQIEGFGGTLRGESADNTIVEVVAPFTFAQDQVPNPYIPSSIVNAPTLFWFERPNGLRIEELTLTVLDSAPVQPAYVLFGRLTTALGQLVADFGGNSNTTVKNVRMIGNTGDFFGKNVGAGLHMMRGSSRTSFEDRTIDGAGDVVVEGCYFENLGDGAIVPMWFANSNISLGGISENGEKRNLVKNSRFPLYLEGVRATKVIVKDFHVEGDCRGTGRSAVGIRLVDLQDGVAGDVLTFSEAELSYITSDCDIWAGNPDPLSPGIGGTRSRVKFLPPLELRAAGG